MKSVLDFISNSTSEEIFSIFLDDALYSHFTKTRYRGEYSETLDKVLSCYAAPKTADWQALVHYVRVEAIRVTVSHTNCLSTQLGLMTALSCKYTTEWRSDEQKYHGVAALIATIERISLSLDERHFVVYALGFIGQEKYEGHALLLIQYKEQGQLTYRILQSYMNHYSLEVFMGTRAAAPMDQERVLCWLEKLSQFVKRGSWDEEKDGLYYDLFGVSLLKSHQGLFLYNDIEISFFFAETSIDRFFTWQAELAEVARGRRYFVSENCIEDDKYKNLLVGQFDPLILRLMLRR